MIVTLSRTNAKQHVCVSKMAFTAFLERISHDDSKGTIAEFRRNVPFLYGEYSYYKGMKTWLHVYPAALYGKDKEDKLSFKKSNGVLLLTFDNIQDLDGIVGIKQKAAMLPSTFSVIEGVDGKTVHVLAKYTDMEGYLPENEEEAEQLYRIAYQEIAPLYQAIIKAKLCDSEVGCPI